MAGFKKLSELEEVEELPEGALVVVVGEDGVPVLVPAEKLQPEETA